MIKKNFSKIGEILKDAKRGKMFILVDDESRENEGDLVIPASKVTAKSISFMAKHGRGLVCLALSQSQANKLNLSLMSPINRSRHKQLLLFLLIHEKVLLQVFLLMIELLQ